VQKNWTEQKESTMRAARSAAMHLRELLPRVRGVGEHMRRFSSEEMALALELLAREERGT